MYLTPRDSPCAALPHQPSASESPPPPLVVQVQRGDGSVHRDQGGAGVHQRRSQGEGRLRRLLSHRVGRARSHTARLLILSLPNAPATPAWTSCCVRRCASQPVRMNGACPPARRARLPDAAHRNVATRAWWLVESRVDARCRQGTVSCLWKVCVCTSIYPRVCRVHGARCELVRDCEHRSEGNRATPDTQGARCRCREICKVSRTCLGGTAGGNLSAVHVTCGAVERDTLGGVSAWWM